MYFASLNLKKIIILNLKVIIPFAIYFVFHLLILNKQFPYVASDMHYYSPRMIDILLHFKCDSIFSIQWWTPTFGAGTPAYPNPGHLQFMITPYLMLLFDPWIATMLTYFAFSAFGYFFILNYLYNHLSFSINVAITSGIVFITNGFWICHTLAGHVNFCTFMLSSLAPYFLSSKWSKTKQVLVLSFLLSYSFYSAGTVFNFSFYLSIPIIYFLLKLMNIKLFSISELLKTLTISHLISLCFVFSKLVAVFHLMENYEREASYSSWQPYIQAVSLSVLFQLFSWRLTYPVENFLPHSADSILFWIIGSRYEFWENDISLSPIVPFIIIIFFFQNRIFILKFIKTNKTIFLGLFLYSFVLSEIIVGKGAIWSLLKDLPVIKSLHVNVRFTSSFILPTILLFAFCYDRIFRNKSLLKSDIYFYLFNCVSLISLFSYYTFFEAKKDFYFYNISDDQKVWNKINKGDHFTPIQTITKGDKFLQHEIFLKTSSSLYPFCPLYGYHDNYFSPKTKLGSINDYSNGFFNFHDPRSFYSPKYYNLNQPQLISDSEALNYLTYRKQPSYKLPGLQIFANYLSFISVMLFLIFVLLYIKKIKLTS